MIVSCVLRLWLLIFRLAAMEGWAFARAVAMSVKVVEGRTGVADGDTYELDASLVLSESAKEGVVLLGLLGEFLLASEVCAKADREEDEGAVLIPIK